MRGITMRSGALGLAGALTLTVLIPITAATARADDGSAPPSPQTPVTDVPVDPAPPVTPPVTTPAPSATLPNTTTPRTHSSHVLKLGSKGRQVFKLEKKLKIDGANKTFGWPTVDRVKQIETWGKITRDGVVDAKTRHVISRYLAEQRAKWLKARKAAAAKAKAKSRSLAGRLDKIIVAARSNSGRPYSYGASGPRAFDCSGYTRYVVRQALGKTLPHQSGAQMGSVKRISRSAARPGDLVFFHGGGGVYHVGIYAGGNKLFHASRPGTRSGLGSIFSSNVSFGRVA